MASSMDKTTRYAVCISDQGDELSVLKGKLYRVLEPEPNDQPNEMRIVDETDDDYLYDASWFVEISLPEKVVAALAPSSEAA